MTRSLEMVKRQRFIYWKDAFGHRNGAVWFGHFSGVLGGYRNPPGEVLGLVGLIGGEEKGPRERGAAHG